MAVVVPLAAIILSMSRPLSAIDLPEFALDMSRNNFS